MYERPGATKKVENVWGDETSGDYAAAARPDYIIPPVARQTEAANRGSVEVTGAPAQTLTPERKNIVTDEAVLDALLGDANFGFQEPERTGNYYGEVGTADPTAPKSESVQTADELYRGDRIENLSRVISTEGALSGPTEFGETRDDIAIVEARYQQQLRAEANPYTRSSGMETQSSTTASADEPVASWMKAAPKRETKQPTSWIDRAKKFFGS